MDAGDTLLVVVVRWGRRSDCGNKKGRAEKHGLESGLIRDDVYRGCWRPRVRADGSGANYGRVDGARHNRLHGEVAERRGRGERVCRRNHVDGCVSMEGTDSLVPGIPLCSEGGKLCGMTCGFVCCPPVSDLLIPALCISGAVDTEMRSPYGSMSIDVHRNLLDFLNTAIFYCVRFEKPTALVSNIAPHRAKIQRIIIMKIMNHLHV